MKNKYIKTSVLIISSLVPLSFLSTFLYRGCKQEIRYNEIRKNLMVSIAGQDKKIATKEIEDFFDEIGIRATPDKNDSIVLRYESHGPFLTKMDFGVYLWDGTYTHVYPPASIQNLRPVGRLSLENSIKYMENHKR